MIERALKEANGRESVHSRTAPVDRGSSTGRKAENMWDYERMFSGRTQACAGLRLSNAFIGPYNK